MSYNNREYQAVSLNYEPVDIIDFENKVLLGEYNAGVKKASTSLSSLASYTDPFTSLKLLPEYVIKKPIYSDEYNNRLSNCVLFDDVVSVALEKLSYFTLGASDELRGVLYPESVRQLKSELEAKNALKDLKVIKNALNISNSIVSSQLSDQEIDQFEKYVHYTDKICKLGSFIRKNHKAAHVFARSASYIEYSNREIPDLGIPEGSPIGLKPLKSQFLGNVIVDRETWKMKAIEYRDSTLRFKEYIDLGVKQLQEKEAQSSLLSDTDTNKQARYFDIDNVLYFVKNNNNMMREEDDFWFGHSTLQSILPLSEENRRINYIVIPMINQGLWAGTGIWFFPNYTTKDIELFFSNYKPGGHIGVGNDQIKFQQTKLDYDYQGILNMKNELKKQMMSAFSIPSFLMNFENVTNRATTETVLIGFNESTIQAERSWISDILDDQWYPKLFESYWPNDEFITAKMKIVLEFSNVAFESFLEKAVACVALIEKGVMTLTEVRNILKLPPLLPEDYAALNIKPPVDLQGAQQFEMVQTPNLVSQLGAMNQKQQQQTASSPAGQAARGNTLSKTELSNMASKAGVGSSIPSLSNIKSQLLNG